MRKTKDERWEALMEYLDEQVEELLYALIERVKDTVLDTDEFCMDQKEIHALIDDVWVRCFLGERRK